MESSENAAIPPRQTTGTQKDFEEVIELPDEDAASDMFVVAKERLLHVNDWHRISDVLKSQFQIVDKQGTELHRAAHKGDFIKIKIPVPENETGGGEDWIRVEAIEYDDYPDESRELIAMRLRPAGNPLNADNSVAHFFSEEATSSFVIERRGKKLSARYSGRNEKPNTDAPGFREKLRNVAVAVGALLGFSDMQWKGVLKGFLE